MRLIDADELIKKISSWIPTDPCGRLEKELPFEQDICVSTIMEIEEAETVEAEPVIHANWEMTNSFDDYGNRFAKCTNCGKFETVWAGYCRECGAKMDKEV